MKRYRPGRRAWIGLLVSALSITAIATAVLPRVHVAACRQLDALSLVRPADCGLVELKIGLHGDLSKLVTISLVVLRELPRR